MLMILMILSSIPLKWKQLYTLLNHIFGLSKAHTFKPNICLIRLIILMFNYAKTRMCKLKYFCFTINFYYLRLVWNHWRIQGAPPACAPPTDPILSFSHMFSPKSVRVGGRRPPPNRSAPPNKILDPPLHLIKEFP